jgi:hypothetical protein
MGRGNKSHVHFPCVTETALRSESNPGLGSISVTHGKVAYGVNNKLPLPSKLVKQIFYFLVILVEININNF